MDPSVAAPLMGKLLDLSIALFVLVLLVVGLGYVVWLLWKANQAQAIAHAAALAEQHALRLKEAQDNADSRHAANQQSQNVIESINRVLSQMQAQGTTDEKLRKMLLDIADKLGLPIKEYI
jgi:uncharacterized protein HemX